MHLVFDMRRELGLCLSYSGWIIRNERGKVRHGLMSNVQNDCRGTSVRNDGIRFAEFKVTVKVLDFLAIRPAAIAKREIGHVETCACRIEFSVMLNFRNSSRLRHDGYLHLASPAVCPHQNYQIRP